MKKININFVAILIIAIMNVNYGYSEGLGNNSYVPNSVTINTNANIGVGEIPMSSSVSQTGAVTYTVPIEVYPGINGMQPELALVYNSHSGNGLMGMGWNVAGISMITRGNKSTYYDNEADGIKLEKDDAFYLDGMRFVRTNGTSTPPKYESEFGNIKATATLSGTTVKYFDVFFPNGTQGRYGSSTNNQNRLQYPLTELNDLFDNKMTYEYDNTVLSNYNHYRISKISYSYHSSASNASVEFQYQTGRADEIFYYSGGLKVTTNYLLEGLVCKLGTTELWRYELAYDEFEYDNYGYYKFKNATVLKQIDYKSSGSKYYNPLQFYYGENNNLQDFQTYETQLMNYLYTHPSHYFNARKGKFDYGTEDEGLIYWMKSHPYGGGGFWNEYHGDEDLYIFRGLSKAYTTPKIIQTEEGFIDIFCANIAGKGNDEVIKVNNKVVQDGNQYYDRIIFKTYEAVEGSSIITEKHTRTFDFNTFILGSSHHSVQPKLYYVGDFLGNGKQQVLAVATHFNYTTLPTKCYLFDLEEDQLIYAGAPFDFHVTFVDLFHQIDENNSDRLLILDYDGDGKSDICLINQTATYMFTFDASHNLIKVCEDEWGFETPYYALKRSDLIDKILMVGDFNGDGKSDFLLSPEVNYTEWRTYYSKGDGNFEIMTVDGTTRNEDFGFFTQDVNSDGQTDLIAFGQAGFDIYFSRNGKALQGTTHHSYRLVDQEPHIVLPINNSVGNNYGQLIVVSDNKAFRYSFLCNTTKEKLLTGSITSLGVVEKNYYRKIYDKESFYDMGTTAIFPHIDFQDQIFVSEGRQKYHNGTKIEEFEYKYENAIFHVQGLDFKGFEKITTTDKIRDNRVRYRKFDPVNFGLLKEVDSQTQNHTFVYDIDVNSQTKIAKINLTQKETVDKLKGITITATYSDYDDYGYPETENIDYGGGISEAFSNVFVHNTTESSYLLGFLTDRTKTITREGETWTTRDYISTHTKGKPTKILRYSGGTTSLNQVSEEIFEYYTNGNCKKQGVKPFSETTPFTTDYEYDNWGRMTKETDPFGPSSFFTTYHYATNGSLSKITAHKNSKSWDTSFDYDEFYRQISATYSDGTIASKERSWNSAGTNGLFYVEKTATGKPWSKTFYDALGRETASETQSIDNTASNIHKVYDNFGRLSEVSVPFTGSSPSSWDALVYDIHDRPTAANAASGRTTTIAYDEKEVTIVEEDITTIKEYDNYGYLVKVTDPAGVITYELRPDGQPHSIVAPGNVTTSFTYDKYGRKETMVDPSAGTQVWTYDPKGNIESEEDANENLVTYGYDNYNRIETVARPEFTTTYYYNPDGLLTSETSTNGTSMAYSYDTYRRLTSEKETVPDGKWLKKIFSYSDGNVQTVNYTTHSGNIGAEYYTYTNGHLTEIKLGPPTVSELPPFENRDGKVKDTFITIRKLNSVNEFGQPTSVTTGAFNRTYAYDEFGIPTGRTAGTFQNHSYSFDAQTRNLTSRKDNNRNIEEIFAYDDLNRLKSFGENSSITYDAKGNITQKSDAGVYFNYAIMGKPYALSHINSPTDAISPTPQSILYNSFQRPDSISEGIYAAKFTNNSSGGRVKMELKKNNAQELTRYYISDCYEIDNKVGNDVVQKLYLGGNFYTAPAVYVKENSDNWQLYYIVRDYLGSITHITNAAGSVIEENSFDAWGRMRNKGLRYYRTPYIHYIRQISGLKIIKE